MRTLLWVAVVMFDARISLWLRLNHPIPPAEFTATLMEAVGGAFGGIVIGVALMVSLTCCAVLDMAEVVKRGRQ